MGGRRGYVAVLPDASLECFFTLIFEIDLCFIYHRLTAFEWTDNSDVHRIVNRHE